MVLIGYETLCTIVFSKIYVYRKRFNGYSFKVISIVGPYCFRQLVLLVSVAKMLVNEMVSIKKGILPVEDSHSW